MTLPLKGFSGTFNCVAAALLGFCGTLYCVTNNCRDIVTDNVCHYLLHEMAIPSTGLVDYYVLYFEQ